MKEKKWHNGEDVIELPEYVRFMENKNSWVRGETREHVSGEVSKVKNYGKYVSINGSLRWQRYPYRTFIPATKEEYDKFCESKTSEMGNGYRGFNQVIIVNNQYINPVLYHYVLLDWGGNIEQTEVMTAYEAKLRNAELLEKEPRIIRWASKDGEIKPVYLDQPPTQDKQVNSQ